MALKRRYSSADDIPKELKALYAERDGAWLLDLDGEDDAGDISALRKEREKAKGLAAEIKSIREAIGDATPQDLRKLKARLEELETERELAGKSAEERMRHEAEKIARERQREREQYQADLQKAAAERDEARTVLKRERITNALTRAASKVGVRDAYVDDVLLRAADFDEVDGQIVALEQVDGERHPRRHPDDPRKYMDPEAYLASMRNAKPDWYRANAGGGAGGGEGRRQAGTVRTVSRTDNAGILANLDAMARGEVVLDD